MENSMHNLNLFEKVSYEERQKRSRRMHNIVHKLTRAKEIKSTKYASKETLHARALKLARMILRKRVAGVQGSKYATLNTAQKMAIDKLVDSLPKKRHKELARRLLPFVVKSEQTRLMALRASKSKSIKEELSTSRRLRHMAGAQRSAHKRKHARAHSRPVRPHERSGELRALSRISISAALKQIFPGVKPKSQEGKTALAMMRSRFIKSPTFH